MVLDMGMLCCVACMHGRIRTGNSGETMSDIAYISPAPRDLVVFFRLHVSSRVTYI